MATEQLTLANAHARAREHLLARGGPADAAEGVTANDATALAEWIRRCAAKVLRDEYLLPPSEADPADTLYLWLNDATSNLDAWWLAAFGYVWERRRTTLMFNELFDAVVGHESGDVTEERFTLRDLDPLREVVSRLDNPHIASPVISVQAMALVDQALRTAGDIGVRVALSCSEEPLIGLWTWDHDGWTFVAHVDDSTWR